MNNALRSQIKNYLIDYLRLKKPEIKITGQKLFICPFESEHQIHSDKPSCNIYPPNSGNLFCFSPEHQKIGDIFGLVRRVEEDKANLSDEAVGEYLVELFKIQTDDKVEKALMFYQINGFDLVPVEKNGKAAIEKEWTKKIHKNIIEWQDWLGSGLNLGIKTGKPSNITVIDFDLHGAEIPANVKELIGETLTQKTKNGYHFIFGYEEDIPKTNFELGEIHIDVMADGGQIVCFPSLVDGVGREFNDSPIATMPKEFKDWLISYIKPIKKEENSEVPNFDDLKLMDLEGCRNNSFLKLGGLLRKKLNTQQTSDVLFLMNSLLPNPLPGKEIAAMIRQLDKYNLTDKNELRNKVLAHIDLVGDASSRDLKDSLGFGKAEIEQVLAELLREQKIYKTGRLYRKINRVEFRDTFVGESKQIEFKMPFFHDIATFRRGDMIIIGAKTGEGKSHVAMNIIKDLVKQGIKPNYLSLEAGNRFTSIALQLGLAEGSFNWANCYRPEQIEFEDNAVTIIDWVLPDVYADTDKLYKRFSEQLDVHGGIAIIFVQLRADGEFFAKNLIDFFPALVCKFRHPNAADRTRAIFETSKIRESESRQQFVTIKVKYDFESKILEVEK
jgi:Bifunctional DNA primase/polymerase, N-terminal